MSEEIKVGEIVKGTVLKVKPFGAIVSLPENSVGLVHISHISNEFIENIDDYISQGDEIDVKILSIEKDKDKSKIALSIKEVNPTKPEKKEFVKKNFVKKEFVKRDDRRENNFEKTKSNTNFFNNKSSNTFEDKMKEFLKSSNDKQASINKRIKNK